MCFATLRPLNFSKEKKGKKRKPFVQVEGFKKASFFDKILPDRVEILSKTGGSNLLFCKPGTYLCSLFFYFLF